jgi:hypothetical protein
MDIMKAISNRMESNKQTNPIVLTKDGILIIDCKACNRVPEMRTIECIRCVVDKISVHGCGGRIRLRTFNDMELCDKAVKVLCELSQIETSVKNLRSTGRMRSCITCEYSCVKVFDIAWQGFPDPHFDAARKSLMGFRAEDKECVNCLGRTYRALDQVELEVRELQRKVVAAYMDGGI